MVFIGDEGTNRLTGVTRKEGGRGEGHVREVGLTMKYSIAAVMLRFSRAVIIMTLTMIGYGQNWFVVK